MALYQSPRVTIRTHLRCPTATHWASRGCVFWASRAYATHGNNIFLAWLYIANTCRHALLAGATWHGGRNSILPRRMCSYSSRWTMWHRRHVPGLCDFHFATQQAGLGPCSSGNHNKGAVHRADFRQTHLARTLKLCSNFNEADDCSKAQRRASWTMIVVEATRAWQTTWLVPPSRALQLAGFHTLSSIKT